MLGCHKDDDSTNNRLTNLEWGTPKQNAITCSSLGNGGRQKLNGSDRDQIKRLRAAGMSGRDIAKMFGVSAQRVCDVVHDR